MLFKVSCLLLFVSNLAAHPDIIYEQIRWEKAKADFDQTSKGPLNKFTIEGPFNIGDPVHETLTKHALNDARFLGRAYSEEEDAVFIRGAIWNDDPTVLLFPNENSTQPSSKIGGLKWYSQFKNAKNDAVSNIPIHVDNLLGRSHFGDLQFLHAMANADGIPAERTHAQIIMWAEFAYKVAIGDISPTTRLNEVKVSGIPELFKGNATKSMTVQELFHSKSVRQVAAGSLLHMIQDSFADGHVEREITTRTNGTEIRFGRGSIRSFHSYIHQDEDAHKRDDKFPDGLVSKDEKSIGTGEDPISHGAEILKFIFAKKRADGRIGADWSEAREYLLAKVFYLPDSQKSVKSGPGEAYRKK